jgi:hypothetical protein
VRPDGTFSAGGVMPGEYWLRVTAGSSGPRPFDRLSESAIVPVTVTGDDITGLAVTTTKGATVRGRVVFEGSGNSRPGPVQLYVQRVSARQVGARTERAIWNADGTFEISGVVGKSLFRVQMSPPGWFLKSILLDGRDITDLPIDFGASAAGNLEVVLTQQRTRVTGTALDNESKPVTDYAIVVFAEDRDKWIPYTRMIGAERADRHGRFSIEGLPAGQYRAAAIEYLDEGQERDPEVLKRLENRASPLVLTDGESKTISLQLIKE